MGGLAFVSPQTVLPIIAKDLGATDMMIAFIPSATLLGFMLPQLFVAHWVERRQWMKPFVLSTGVFQRLPYLLCAVFLYFWGDAMRSGALAMVLLTPLISGAIGGLSAGAWMELVSRVIPARRLASSWAMRYIIMGATGMLAGMVIQSTLAEHPGSRGYGLLFFYATGCLAVSFLVFMMIREPNVPAMEPSPGRGGFLEHLQRMPELLQTDERLRRFILMRATSMAFLVVAPFLAIHALEVTGRSSSFLGALVTAQMVGGILGNVAAGYLGDRFGGKLPAQLANVLFLAVAVAAMMVQTDTGFLILFGVFGAAGFMEMVGNGTLSLEICPPGRRPTYMALMAGSAFLTMVVAGLISGWIREMSISIVPAAMVAVVGKAISGWQLMRIKEPREGVEAWNARR